MYIFKNLEKKFEKTSGNPEFNKKRSFYYNNYFMVKNFKLIFDLTYKIFSIKPSYF